MPEVNYGSLPFAKAIDYLRGKLNVDSESWRDIWEQEHDNAFMVAGAAADDVLLDLRTAVDKAIADGETLEQFRKRFDEAVAEKGWAYTGGRNWRSKIIYETNLRQAYNAGREEQIEAAKVRRPYALYRHGDSVSPRAQHKAWDGLVLPVDDPFWQTHTPQNGYGCKCKKYSLSESAMKRRGLKVGTRPTTIKGTKTILVKGRETVVPNYVGVDDGFAYRPTSAKRKQGLAGARQEKKDRLTQALAPKTSAGEAPAALGPAVSEALAVSARDAKRIPAQRVVEIIDKVHGDGALPQIPLRASATRDRMGRGELGVYRRNRVVEGHPQSDTAVEIVIKGSGSDKEMTIAHEIGHFLDHKGLSGKGMSSEDRSHAVGKIISALQDTETMRAPLRSAAQRAMNRVHINYWTRRREIWARAYAQYIANKSGDAAMRKQLTAMQEKQYYGQWTDEEFLPVQNMIDELFQELGWITR